jgi:heme/copper-type cytochrome/quinol oxidase subunit 2
VIVPKCGGGKGTAESDVRTLKVNVKGYDWDMKFIYRGNNYMSVSNIYLKGLEACGTSTRTHENQLPDMNNI